MFCPNCGEEAKAPDARFCANCGRSLAETAGPGVAPPLGAVVEPAGQAGAVAVGTVTRPMGKSVQTVAGTFELAGFGVRLGGWLVDLVVFFIGGVVLGLLVGVVAAASGGEAGAESEAIEGVLNLMVFIGWFAAVWVFNTIGWSPGKRAVGLRIIDERGAPPGAGKGLGRTLGSIVSGLPIYLGYLWAAWDGKNQTWHDKMAGTYVVRLR